MFSDLLLLLGYSALVPSSRQLMIIISIYWSLVNTTYYTLYAVDAIISRKTNSYHIYYVSYSYMAA
jgi:hypothetical protein